MKITVTKAALMEKLTPAMGTVSNKNTITSIEGVLIETLKDGKIQISTYDMNKGVRATLDAVSIESWNPLRGGYTACRWSSEAYR